MDPEALYIELVFHSLCSMQFNTVVYNLTTYTHTYKERKTGQAVGETQENDRRDTYTHKSPVFHSSTDSISIN